MVYRVIFTPEAEAQLTDLYRYISKDASPAIAARFTEAIVTYCESLRNFPARGVKRDDIRPGLRVVGYRKRIVIAFDIEKEQVNILGVFYGGRNYKRVLKQEENEEG